MSKDAESIKLDDTTSSPERPTKPTSAPAAEPSPAASLIARALIDEALPKPQPGAIYQYGITADSFRSAAFIRQLREWLSVADGPTSIPYRIEGLDPKGVYPRVFTATPCESSAGPGFAYGHVINIHESLLIADRHFVDDDCPEVHFLEVSHDRAN